ncbi:MAG: retropepsin-like aspartic protease [Planctomycetota bacterium]
MAQSTDSTSDAGGTKRYSPAVVEKADKVLDQAGLKRTGKSIVSTRTTAIARTLGQLNRQRRELRLVAKESLQAKQRLELMRANRQKLLSQDVEFGLKLAQVAPGDVTTNNKLVGLLRAVRSQIESIDSEIVKAKAVADQQRNQQIDAEAKYAESVLAIRSDLNQVRNALSGSLQDKSMVIAWKVMVANFGVTTELTVESITGSLERRLTKIEEEIFSESIPLEVTPGGSLFFTVTVGAHNTRVVGDRGAAIMALPARTAAKLQLQVPADADKLILSTADGREISARAIILPKVRVGKFEAANVRAAVIDASADNAEPLLGMSFLGQFKFEINSAEKTLSMLRVQTD